MKVDMSPEAITNRLKMMEQLWQLSVNLMSAREISKTDLPGEKSLTKNERDRDENSKILNINN